MQSVCWIWAYGIGRFQLELDSLNFCNHQFYNLPASFNFTDLDVKEVFQDFLNLDYPSKPGANHKRPKKLNRCGASSALGHSLQCETRDSLSHMQTHTHTELREWGTRQYRVDLQVERDMCLYMCVCVCVRMCVQVNWGRIDHLGTSITRKPGHIWLPTAAKL